MEPSKIDRAGDTIHTGMRRIHLRGRGAGGRYLRIHGTSDDNATLGRDSLLPDSKVVAAIMLSARLFRH